MRSLGPLSRVLSLAPDGSDLKVLGFVSELAGRIYVADLDHPGKAKTIFHGRGKLTGLAYLRG